MVAPGRRTRRLPPWMLIGIVLTVLVLVVSAAAGGDSERPEERLRYLDAARPLIERSTGQGGDLADVRARAAAVGRDGVRSRLDRLTRDASALLTELERLTPPARLTRSHALLVATFAGRADGARAVRASLDGVLGDAPPEQAVAPLVAAGRTLAAADRVYELFLRSVPERDEAALAASTWVADPLAWEQAEVQLFVFSLRASTSLQPVRDVAVVTFATEPASVAAEGEVRVLPVVKTLRVQIVVGNAGNESLRRVPVVAELTAATEAGPDTARDFVDLAPGQRTTVQLGGLRVTGTGPYILRVAVGPIDGEANPVDNEQRLMFTMR